MNTREAGMQGIAGYLPCSHGQGIVQLSAGICPVRTGRALSSSVQVFGLFARAGHFPAQCRLFALFARAGHCPAQCRYLPCSHGQGIVQLSAGICPVRTAGHCPAQCWYLPCSQGQCQCPAQCRYLPCSCRHGNWRRAVSVELSAGYLACFAPERKLAQSRVSGAQCRLFGLFAPERKLAEQSQWSPVQVIWPVCRTGTETGAEQCQWSSVQVIWPFRTGTETSRAESVELSAGCLACWHRHAQLKEWPRR